jgi:large subunit ribosomal protein L1
VKRSKSYRAAAEKIDADALYTPLEAVRLAKQTSTTKYDATVEVAMRLGVDPRKADQMVRGTVNLPHGTGKTAQTPHLQNKCVYKLESRILFLYTVILFMC